MKFSIRSFFKGQCVLSRQDIVPRVLQFKRPNERLPIRLLYNPKYINQGQRCYLGITDLSRDILGYDGCLRATATSRIP